MHKNVIIILIILIAVIFSAPITVQAESVSNSQKIVGIMLGTLGDQEADFYIEERNSRNFNEGRGEINGISFAYQSQMENGNGIIQGQIGGKDFVIRTRSNGNKIQAQGGIQDLVPNDGLFITLDDSGKGFGQINDNSFGFYGKRNNENFSARGDIGNRNFAYSASNGRLTGEVWQDHNTDTVTGTAFYNNQNSSHTEKVNVREENKDIIAKTALLNKDSDINNLFTDTINTQKNQRNSSQNQGYSTSQSNNSSSGENQSFGYSAGSNSNKRENQSFEMTEGVGFGESNNSKIEEDVFEDSKESTSLWDEIKNGFGL